MKRLGFLFIFLVTLMMTSCNALQTTAGSGALAQTAGQTCGSAILGLYNAYKSTGTISLADPANLGYALSLATAYTQIKQNKDNKSYRKAFTSGLILSSAGLITKNNSNAFLDALLAANGLSTLNTSSSPAQTQTATNSISGLLKTL